MSGEPKTGTMEAKDKHDLARILHERGYILIEAKSKKKERRRELTLPGWGRVSLKDKLMFTRNLQIMIKAGIPLPRALATLAPQTKSRRFKKALLDIAEAIGKGKSFSEALQKYPAIFSSLFYHMIKVGEESGTLEEILKNLALQMEREAELKSKVKSALIYPTVIVSVMIIIAILMLVMVVPKLADVFKDLDMKLPLTTQVVVNIGTFLAGNFLLVSVVFFAILSFFYFALKTQGGRRARDALLLKTPIIAPLIKKVNASHAVRNLGILTASGVPFLRSLEIVAGVLPNVYFKAALLEAKENVKRGGKLSESLAKHQDIFPSTVIQMLEVGEETGETSKILEELADFFEQEVTVVTKNLVSIIEPLLMVLIGATVGFFAVSMIQPIYSMLGGF